MVRVLVRWAPRAGLRLVERDVTPEELDRAGRLRVGADAWLATRCWVRARLAEDLGCRPADVPIVVDGRGRPSLAAAASTADLSIAHSDSVVALATGPVPLGVDVEDRPAPAVDLRGVAEVVASPRELEELRTVADADLPRLFQRWWTRKEALVKARGAGFLEDPTRLDVGWAATTRVEDPWVVHDLGVLTPRLGGRSEEPPALVRARPVLTVVTAGPAVVRVEQHRS